MSAENSTWLTYRPSPITLRATKIMIGLLLVWVLWYKISLAIQADDFSMPSLSSKAYLWLITAAFLTFINWLLEAKKWQILVSPFQKMKTNLAYKSVLAGLSTGLITPNRLGNFIGRLAYINNNHKVQATINTQVGNLAQFIITIMMGIIGLSVSLTLLTPNINPYVFIGIPTLLLVLSIWLYLYPKAILRLPFGKKMNTIWSKEVDDLSKLSITLKSHVLKYGIGRYFVFLAQYYCLFMMFGIPISPLLTGALAATTFLITTVIPGVFFGKLIVRESAALFAFSLIALPIPVILFVSFLLWLINLAIPAMFGWYFWIKKPKR